MGMAASQSRLLQLTCRKNDIGYELTRLSNEKVSLTRDMQKVSRNYHDALSQKTLKWSNNSGISYIDLSYNNLMKPSAMNNYEAYLLTDTNDRVVISTNYEKYAKLISANGAPGGNWDSIRSQTLEDLTGISASRIDEVNTSNQMVQNLENEVNKLIDKEPKPDSSFVMKSFEDIVKRLGKINIGSFDDNLDLTWEHKYNTGNVICIGNKDKGFAEAQTADTVFLNALNTIADSLKKYFPDYQEEFDSAINTLKENYLNLIQTGTNMSGAGGVLTGDPSSPTGYQLSLRNLLQEFEGALIGAGCEYRIKNDDSKTCIWYDVDNPKYTEWKNKHNAWTEELKAKKESYQAAVQDNAQLLTAEDRSLIAFYDTIFTTIAEKGWTRNKQVEDTDYLNQMLQNNFYRITTVKTEDVHNYYTGKSETKNVYNTDLAMNFSKIFAVNDNEAREEALSTYEHDKSIINEKESRIDVRMKNLETEQSAINQMLQGLEQVKKNNIERTFNITG